MQNNTYGIYDVRDNLWLGDDKGPLMWSDYRLAKAYAIVASKRIGRLIEARIYDPSPKIKRDTITPGMSCLEALKKIIEEE